MSAKRFFHVCAGIVCLAVALWVECLVGGCSRSANDPPREETILQLKGQCRESGATARHDWVAQFHRETFSDTPEYAYSPELKTCLYADEYADDDSKVPELALIGVKMRRVRFVLDVYANKELFVYVEHDGHPFRGSPVVGDPEMCRTEQEFEARKTKLFALNR